MSGSSTTSGRVWLLVVVLVVVVGGLVVLGGNDSSNPYDLSDPKDAGYKGLRLVLERLGTHIEEIDAAQIGERLAQPDTVVYVPVASGTPRVATRRWDDAVRRGGRLVVGTPRLDIAPHGTVDEFGDVIIAAPPGDCDIDGLASLRAIDPAGSDRLRVPAGAQSCFGDGSSALVVRQSLGDGSITTLASPGLFTNDAMRPHNQEVDDPKTPMRDNVVLATELLAPQRGGQVAVVTSGLASAEVGSSTLVDLLGSGVRLGLAQLVVAFGFYAWWRGRRHGRVVVEHQPVAIAGSELVAAVGNLMERRNDPAHAATLVRAAATNELAERLGAPRGTDVSVVAGLVATRCGRDPAVVLAALASTPVTTDAQLVAVVEQVESIRSEVLHGRSPH